MERKLACHIVTRSFKWQRSCAVTTLRECADKGRYLHRLCVARRPRPCLRLWQSVARYVRLSRRHACRGLGQLDKLGLAHARAVKEDLKEWRIVD